MIIAASLLVTFALAPAAPDGPPPPVITVVGYGTDKALPDRASITFEVEGENGNSQSALKELGTKAARIEATLRRIDPDLTLTNDEFAVRQIKGPTCNENAEEGRLRLSTGACAVIGYRVAQSFNVETGRVLDAGTMAGAATREGARNPSVSSFNLADPASAKTRAIALAIQDARSKADAIAQGGGVRLGPIVSFQLDGARNQDIIVTGMRRRPPPPAAERDDVPVVFKPEPVRTSAEVTATFAIAR